jgi:hypothetical protein
VLHSRSSSSKLGTVSVVSSKKRKTLTSPLVENLSLVVAVTPPPETVTPPPRLLSTPPSLPHASSPLCLPRSRRRGVGGSRSGGRRELRGSEAAAPQLRQYLYFCTSKASTLSIASRRRRELRGSSRSLGESAGSLFCTSKARRALKSHTLKSNHFHTKTIRVC